MYKMNQRVTSVAEMRSLSLRGRACKHQLICVSLRFSSHHSRFSSVPSGPPVIVGMSINIASIDSISEVNMVRYTLLVFHLLVPAKVSLSQICWSVLMLLSALLPL